MSYRCQRSLVTLQTMILFFLYDTCAQAAFIPDYDTLFQRLLAKSDDYIGSRPKHLEYHDDYGQNNFRKTDVDTSLISKLRDAFLPDSIERVNGLPPGVEDEQLPFEMVDKTSKRAFSGAHSSSPSMSKVLAIIEKLNLPEYKSVTDSVLKRNEWSNNNSVFGSLLQAAYRLGELDVEKPKTSGGRRFHAWGG